MSTVKAEIQKPIELSGIYRNSKLPFSNSQVLKILHEVIYKGLLVKNYITIGDMHGAGIYTFERLVSSRVISGSLGV
jgi:hypothetical protein